MEIQTLKNGCYFEEDQSEKWFKDGILHREDGPALVTAMGNHAWYQNGVLHRVDGPAVEIFSQNMYKWVKNGILHREDGPAIIVDEHKEWWINGIQLSEKDFNSLKLKEKLEFEIPQENNSKAKNPKV